MSDNSLQVFKKCISEAEIRERGQKWKDSEAQCMNSHKEYKEVRDIHSSLDDQYKSLAPLIELIAKLTVRIKIPTETTPPSSIQSDVFGTGFIQRVRRQRNTKKKQSEFEKTSEEYGVLTVSTVHHVISPDSAKDMTINYSKATVKINFDAVGAEIKKATGFTIVESDKDINKYDWCSFECITHDLEMIDILNKHISDLEKERKHAYEFYKRLQNVHISTAGPSSSSEDKSSSIDFVALVGHPHGGPKRVSFGKRKATKEILKQVRDQQEWCCYFHDASTCTGSSGSPVFIFGQPLCGYGYWFGHPHNHSGKRIDGVKVTSIGVDHIEIITDNF